MEEDQFEVGAVSAKGQRRAKPWPTMTLTEAEALLTSPGALFEMGEAVIEGRSYRTWRNVPATLRELFLKAEGYGDREFLVYQDERITYAAFSRATRLLARELQAVGIRPGDRVALAMRNLPEWPVCLFAAVLCGAVVVPLNAWQTGSELALCLRDCGARVVFCDGDRRERLGDHLGTLSEIETVFVTRPLGEFHAQAGIRERTLAAAIGLSGSWATLPSSDLPAVLLAPDDPCVIFYTSGTTGSPKGALGTHRNICTGILTNGFAAARSCLRRGDRLPSIDSQPQQTTLLAVPLFHVVGCCTTLCPAMASGSRIVVMHRWDPANALKLIEQERVNVAGGVPTIAWQLVDHPDRASRNLSSLHTIAYGGAPAPPALVDRIMDALPGAGARNGWGMSETMGTFTSHIGEDYASRPESCGPAAPIGDLRIADVNGKTLPVGEVGELWVRGPQVARRYWNNAKASAEAFVDGWLRTGDIARLDDEGFCYIVDRAKDMLIRGGENIYCVEIENALLEHPGIIEAAIVGRPHPTLGEEPVAFVVHGPDAMIDGREVRDFLARRLAAYKVPIAVITRGHPLPRNVAGKVTKTELKLELPSA